MSISAPFAVVSKCVRRSDSNPEAIFAESNNDNGKDESQEKSSKLYDAEDFSVKLQNQSHYFISKGSAESGWVFRDEGDEPLFSQSQPQPSDPGEDPYPTPLPLVSLIQDVGLYPGTRRLGLHNLPHPSKLRMETPTPETVASNPVAVSATCSSSPAKFPMPGPASFSATSPSLPQENREPRIDPSSSFGSIVPLTEDDEDRWFKSHWKYFEPKRSRKLEE